MVSMLLVSNVAEAGVRVSSCRVSSCRSSSFSVDEEGTRLRVEVIENTINDLKET